MNQKKGYLCIAITTLLFSTMELALKMTAGNFHPVQQTFSRFLVGGLMLLPLAIREWKRRELQMTWKRLRKMALLGLIGICISMTMYQMAVLHTKASVVAVLFSSNPLFVTLFAGWLLGEAVHLRSIVAIALDLAGIFIIVEPWNTHLSPLGVLLTLGSTLLFALYGVLGRGESSTCGGVVTTCASFLFGSTEMMAIAAWTHISPVATWLEGHHLEVFSRIPFVSGYTVETLLPFLYIAVFATGMGYLCWFLSMEYLDAQTASLAFFFKPALATALAVLILHETVPWNMGIGICLVLLGSAISLLGKRRASSRDQG